jgi:hypothetical protein
MIVSYIQIKHYLNEMAKFRANVKKEYSEPKTA